MRLVDLKTLSKQTVLSVYTLRKYTRMGMPHYRAGRKILVDPDEFCDWFQQFKAQPNLHGDEFGQIVDETLNKIGLSSA